MSKINPVKQQHKYACSIACAAMVTGENYDEIIKEFGNNFHKQGIDDDVFIKFIASKGYSTIQKEVTYYSKKDLGRSELLKPFAPVHFVRIKFNADSGLLHWVVMTAKGKFICPMRWSDREIRNCYQIIKVVGIYKD